MPKSERAKELEAKQKAAAKAEKLRKKNSDDPRDWGTIRQMRETYKMAHQFDPVLPWWLLGSFLVGLAVGVVLGLFLDPFWMWIILGIFFGATLAMLVFVRRVKAATYKKFEGQPGSAEVALGMLNKKKWVINPAIAANRQMDSIHRILGRQGLILIAEGDPSRLKQLLRTEVRRHEQVAYGVKVITIQMGRDEGQVPLDKLADHINALPKVLSDSQVAEVKKRLTAIDTMRKRMPVPKGPMNLKGAHRAMRGR